MDHRFSRVRRLEQFLSANLFSWIRADTYSQTASRVTQFNDRVGLGVGIRATTPGHALAQSTAGQRAALPSGAVSLNGAAAAAFVRASAVYYDSNASAARWRFMHDGTGMEFWLVTQPTSNTGVQVVMGTRTTAGDGINVIRGAGGIAGRTSLYNLNGGSFVIQVDADGGGWANGAGTYRSARYATADTPDYTVTSKAATIASGNELIGPAAGDPAIPLRLGSDGTNHADMLFADLLIYKGSPSAFVRRAVTEYIKLYYRIY